MRRGRGIVLLCASAGALALASAPALADGAHPDYPDSTLQLSVAPPASPQHTFTVVATGMNGNPPFTSDGEQYDLEAFLVDPGVQPCPADEQDAFFGSHLAGEGIIDITPLTVSEGGPGPFSVSVQAQVPPGVSGRLLVCGYTSFLGLDDAASASTAVTVTAPSASQPPKLGGTGTTPTAPATAPGRPRIRDAPFVSRAGRWLLCTSGTWFGDPKTFRYRWVVLRRPGFDRRGNVFRESERMRGLRVECLVTATNPAGSATAASGTVKIRV